MTTVVPGHVVDRFRVERTIHRGPRTEMFAAVDLTTGATVALRVLSAGSAHDAQAREHFLASARAGVTLGTHPHLAAVHAWGQAGPLAYLVTDLIPGVGLDEVLRRHGHVEPALLAQIADAVDSAHAAGTAHGRFGASAVTVDLSVSPPVAVVDGFGRPEGRGDLAVLGRSDIDAFTRLCGYAIDPVRATAIAATVAAAGPFPTAAAALAAWSAEPVPLPSAMARVPLSPMPAVDSPASPSRRHRRVVVPALVAVTAMLGAAAALAVALRPSAAVSGTMAADPQPTPDPTTPIDELAERLAGPLASVAGPSTAPPAPTTLPRTTVPATTARAVTTTTPMVTSTTPVIGVHGFVVGEAVREASSPESAFALALARRDDPRSVTAPDSPAFWYAQWVRLMAPASATSGSVVTATSEGFSVAADRPVTLRDFVVEGGVVTSFSECRDDAGCVSIATETRLTPDCAPGAGCPTVTSTSGSVVAYQRVTGLWRWPAQILVYEVVPDDGPLVATVVEPNDVVHYDPTTGHFVSVFVDRPVPGTRHQLTVTFDDGSNDDLVVVY